MNHFPEKILVLFDGQCNLCSQAVQFIAPRDAAGRFQFASLQSPAGQAMLDHYHQPKDLSSMVVVEANRCHLRSAAALRIVRQLKWPWPLLSVLVCVPGFLLDMIYDLVARNRHRLGLFAAQCSLPSAQIQSRMIHSLPSLTEMPSRQTDPSSPSALRA